MELDGYKNDVIIKKAGVYYTFGSFFNKGMAFFTVPFFTRLLSQEDYGIVSTFNAWVSITYVILGMALYMAIRQVYIEFPELIDDYHSTITIFISLFSSIVLLLSIIFGCVFEYNTGLIILCVLQSFAIAIIEDYSMYLMMKYRYITRTALMVIPNLLSVVLSIIIVCFFINSKMYLGRLIPTAVVYLLISIWIVIIVLKKSMVFNMGYLKYCLRISIPLIAHGMSLTILAQSDRTMITEIIGANETAVYSVIYNFSTIATVLSTALAGVWQPWFLKQLRNNTDSSIAEINEFSKIYSLVMTAAMCCIILVAPEVLHLLAPESYWKGISIVPPIVLSSLITFVYTFYVDVEHYYKKTKIIAVNTMMAAIINIILNLMFIPRHGYIAAAYTTVASYLFSLVFHSREAMKLEFRIKGLTNYWINLFCVVLVTFVFYWLTEHMIIRWLVALAIMVVNVTYIMKKYHRRIW